jgi:hypothetical protein
MIPRDLKFKKRRTIKRANNRKAIVLTEFVLALLMIAPLLLAVLRVSGTHTFGSYSQYATFMTARAYLSGGLDEDDRTTRTINAFESYLGGDVHLSYGQPRTVGGGAGGLPTGLEIIKPNDLPGSPESPLWGYGVRYNFRAKLFPNFMGKYLSEIFEMEAESFLGKEPSKEECESDMVQLGGNTEYHWDNGC